MAERKWGSITSGATFESLATTIVFFEDPKAALFGRRGKDGGQDARSGDGTRVFQAKHHENNSAAAAIRDARKEAEKIEEYRKTGHSRYGQWQGVTHWRLVTNAVFNPTDRQTWATDITPIFAKLGLTADYWERANLDGLLDKHPEIHRSYFEHETRVFLTIPEVKERLPQQEPFLRRDELSAFCGRLDERMRVRDFLASDELFLVVHGAGGTGKTRLLVEAGDEIAADGAWQVLWANVESMAASTKWWEGVVPERATLLLLDEPLSETVLQQLVEQLGGRVGRVAKWKVAVAVRSPKDPVLGFLRSARMRQRMQEMALAPLSSSDAEGMCFALLRAGRFSGAPENDLRDLSRKLANFARHPVWLTLAVQQIENHGNLHQVPVDAGALADEYLDEIERSQSAVSPESVRALLRWVALIGTVNREDDSTVKLVGDQSGIASSVEVRARIASLVRRRALTERGARNRLIELKPDVLRDHVLLRWLSSDVGGRHPVASEDATELLDSVRGAIEEGALSRIGRAILESLARTEFVLRLSGHDTYLMRAFFAGVDPLLPTLPASRRIALAEALADIAPYQPDLVTSTVRRLRQDAVPDEVVAGPFGVRTFRHEDVVLSLPWTLYVGAMAADDRQVQERVLRELCRLVEEEAMLASSRPRGLPNDGRRASGLVTKVIEGGPQFSAEYDAIASEVASELLGLVSNAPPSVGQSALLDALVQPLLALQRTQVWSGEPNSFTWRTVVIAKETTAWTARTVVFEKLKIALSSDTTPAESRLRLWHTFAEAHRHVIRCRGRANGDWARTEILNNLSWAQQLLSARTPDAAELHAAREVWNWHHRFDTDSVVQALADTLESQYMANELAHELVPLLGSAPEDYHTAFVKREAKGTDLASVAHVDDINAFVDRAVAFLRDQGNPSSLFDIARSMGFQAQSHEVVQTFVARSLAQRNNSAHVDFGVNAAAGWVAAVRQHTPERTHLLVGELLAGCADDERRANLLVRLYAAVPRHRSTGDLTPDEHRQLCDSVALFTGRGRHAAFVGSLAQSFAHDWHKASQLIAEVLACTPDEHLSHATRVCIEAIYWAVRDTSPSVRPAGLARWLMEQLLRLPDLEVLSNEDWNLREIFKGIGKLDVRWLPEAFELRRQMEATRDDGIQTRALSFRTRISAYVAPVAGDDATDDTIVDAVAQLVAFVSDTGTIGFYLPDVLRDIDPDGLVVPEIVVARFASASQASEVRRLARVASAYAVNSVPWRSIALAAIRCAKPYGEDTLRSVYGALGASGVRSWSSAIGEVPAVFINAVAAMEEANAVEEEFDLRPYWLHHLRVAESELREQEERAKEERGE
jgi:hypothetical protein